MSTLKKNRRITAILYAILIIVVVSVFCISLFSTAIGDKKEKSAAPKATEQATRPITVTEKIPDLSSGSDAALPAQTEPAATETEAPAEPTVSLVPTYSMPIVGGTVSKTFSDSVATYSQTMNDYRVHTGIDIYAPVGTAVVCCSDGVIENVWEDPFDGTCVLVDHGNGLRSRYCNLSPELPKSIVVGAAIMEGETLGGVGQSMITESADTHHLHFEMSVDGTPVDPLSYIDPAGEDADVFEDIAETKAE